MYVPTSGCFTDLVTSLFSLYFIGMYNNIRFKFTDFIFQTLKSFFLFMYVMIFSIVVIRIFSGFGRPKLVPHC